MSPDVSCPPSADNVFGPWAGQSCRGGFDFTLLFEESILTIPLVCIFLLLLPWRVWHLSRQRRKVMSSPLQSYKVISTVLLAALQLAVLVLWSKSSPFNTHRTKASVPTAAISFIAAIGVCILSWFEHLRSVRPSSLLDIYLFLSVLFDIARARTLWLMRHDPALAAVFTSTIAVRCVMLTFESYEKRSILETQYKSYPPEAICGPFNRGVFWWLSSLFLRGYSNILTLQDLFPLQKRLRSERLHSQFQQAWDQVADKKKSNALFVTWCKTQKWTFLQAVVPRVLRMGFTFAQPFMVQRGVEFAATPETGVYNNTGYGLIGAYLIVYSGLGLCTAQYEYIMWGLAVKMRGAMVPSIYGKTLTLKTADTQPAAALTLVSTDIETATTGIVQLHELWASPVELGLAIYLLYRQLGVACVIPIALAIATFIITGSFATLIQPSQANWNNASQKRVAKTSSILGNIKWLKMCGLTNDAFAMLHNARVYELKVSERFRKLLAATVILATVTPILAPVLTFATYIGMHSNDHSGFTVTKAFTSLSLFALLSRPLTNTVLALPFVAGSLASFGRMQAYLNIAPREDYRTITSPGSNAKSSGTSVVIKSSKDIELTDRSARTKNETIVLLQGQFRWSDTEDRGIKIPHLQIRRNTFTIILGPVGSGKSTILKCLLGELPGFEGNVDISSLGVAYCDQLPWLPNGTVRDLITCRLDFDEQWYQTVIKACALEADMDQWAQGDQAVVGSKGISVSGGQKQRLSLARAVYSRRELIVLDDNFSGLDSTTSNQVFHNLLGRNGLLLRTGRTVVAASSDARQAPYSDHVVVLDQRGTIIEDGSFSEVSSRGTYLAGLTAQEEAGDQSKREDITKQTSNVLANIELPKAVQAVMPETGNAAVMNRQTGDTSVYGYYLRSAGLWGPIIFTSSMAIYAFCDSFPNVWLKWWTEANARNPNTGSGKWLGVYGALSGAAVISLLGGAWQFFIVTITKSGLFFHSLLVNTVSRAPMSFFSTVDNGITINRFSQDLQLIDMELPSSALSLVLTVSICIAQAILMAVASRYIAIVFPFLVIVFYAIQRFYLRTSRQMRFLDIEHKAPLYSQLMEIFTGLPTIRAYEWQTETMQHSLKILDESQRPVYLLYVLQRWLVLSIDLTIALMATVLITITTTLRQQIGPGYMGIALTNVMAFGTTMESLLITWVTVEIAIGAIARIKNFVSSTEVEGQSDGSTGSLDSAPNTWPETGAIDINKVFASYHSTGPVLKSVSLSIRGGEKIGICGRTGSGKSSLVSCLLRLLDIDAGSISVDGIDITTIPHEEVRARLVAVPQEPFIFEETIKLNLDPSHTASDEEIIQALQKVQLWDTIEARGGLETSINTDFFSEGQKRLFGLARALLRKSKVLLLDEVTTGLDRQTADIIDKVVNEVFDGWTIISVAHRLESILQFDRIAVLDNGLVLEFDQPRTLLDNPDSAFRRLVNDSQTERRGQSQP